jgi:spermidine/putrescine transport system substrate-binding protein
MKTLHTSVLAITVAATFGAPAWAEDTLHIYNWTGYTSQALLDKFTAETGITVSLDTFDNNETLLAKLRSGSSGYDITIASTDFLEILIAEGLVQKVDIPSLANYANLDAQFKESSWDPGNAYSVPWHWGITSYQVDTAVWTGEADSLKLLFEPPPELQGQVGMFSSPTEVIALALRYLDKTMCTDDVETLKALDAVLQAQKPHVKIYDSAGLADRQVSGETLITQVANGEAMRARLQKPSLTFVFAKEGGVAWVDNVVVPSTAARPDLALKFIDFIMDPANAVIEQQEIGYPTGIPGATALLPAELAGAPELSPPEGYKTYVNPTCSAETLKKYDLIWTKLRQ